MDVWASGVLLYLFCTGAYPFGECGLALCRSQTDLAVNSAARAELLRARPCMHNQTCLALAHPCSPPHLPSPAAENPACPQNAVETLRNIARGAYRPLPARLSPELRDLLQRMMCLDPRQRISLEGVAAHPWLQAHGCAATDGATADAAAPASAAASPAAPASPVAFAPAADAAQPMETEAEALPLSFAAPAPATFSFGTHVECKPTPQLVQLAAAAPAGPATPAACGVPPASPTTPDTAAARHGFLGAFTSCWFGRT